MSRMPASDSEAESPPEPMLICFCHGVSEAEIRRAIAEGARSIADIQAKTKASTGCGGCGPELEKILAEALEKE
jgi:assimilatory nitrate reductase electron transfer subunit